MISAENQASGHRRMHQYQE